MFHASQSFYLALLQLRFKCKTDTTVTSNILIHTGPHITGHLVSSQCPERTLKHISNCFSVHGYAHIYTVYQKQHETAQFSKELNISYSDTYILRKLPGWPGKGEGETEGKGQWQNQRQLQGQRNKDQEEEWMKNCAENCDSYENAISGKLFSRIMEAN